MLSIIEGLPFKYCKTINGDKTPYKKLRKYVNTIY